jgi:hypothetical protein
MKIIIALRRIKPEFLLTAAGIRTHVPEFFKHEFEDHRKSQELEK